ncbi:MAG: ferrous iron transport protein B [Flavobacteriales bacterium]
MPNKALTLIFAGYHTLSSQSTYQIVLAGNPNSGKTSLFNALTGLNQKVGNFPGVTVDRKLGKLTLSDGKKVSLMDLPGAYSLYPKSIDEEVVEETLLNENTKYKPDLIVLVVDGSNLKRNLFLASQIIDLQYPTICVVNMVDVAQRHGIEVDLEALKAELGIPVYEVNAQTGKGVKELKHAFTQEAPIPKPIFDIGSEEVSALGMQAEEIQNYADFHFLASSKPKTWWSDKRKSLVSASSKASHEIQLQEITARYKWINKLSSNVIQQAPEKASKFTNKLDKVLTHPLWGSLVFFLVFFLMFQALFTLAAWPMTWIDNGMGLLVEWTRGVLPDAMWADFITSGILAGLAGVIVFIPQIVILFGMVTILEDSGYMARVSFLNDALLRKVGMNGKSVVPLVGGFACAVPAVMAARSIENMRERLITIFVTPLMSCSARLPVYVFLVAFIVPDNKFYGVFSMQGLFMFFLYMLGIIMSAAIGFLIGRFMKGHKRGSFIMELPTYKLPRWQNVISSMWQKGQTFVMEAGKVIVIVSMVLWFLSSFGPSGAFEAAEELVVNDPASIELSEDELAFAIESEKLRSSYAGLMGRFIEPAIEPLGFDWKIGIALITSFAAREVFVGTMSTIYSVEGDTENIQALQEKLSTTINPKTGEPIMGMATAFSLAIFYVFAMQCMSTVAVVRKETNGWKWPLLQLFLFTAIAYFASLLTFQILT